jgi:hypothetical protein
MSQSNYTPDPSGDVVSNYHGNLGNLYYTSDPNGVIYGRKGWTLFDTVNEVLYVNTGSGYNTTWTEYSASGGGGAGLTYHQSGDLDPNGVITGSVGDVFHSRVSAGGDGTTWWKVSGSGNTGWE